MKLGYKGLLLVSVPLVLQLIVVLTMSVLLWQEQEQVAKQASAREVIAKCNQITQSAGEIVRHLYPLPGGFLDAGPVVLDQLNTFKTSVRELEVRLGSEPEQQQRLQQFSKAAAQFIPLLYAARARKDRVDKVGVHDSERLLMAEVSEVYSILSAIIASEDTKHRADPEQRLAVREKINNSLTAAVIVTVLLTIGLAYGASVGIRKPLTRMSENAQRISRREPLHTPLIGSDELAELDGLFHDVDAAIEEALKQEHNLIDCAADVVCLLDQHGIFMFLNPYVSDLLGFDRQELLGTSIISLVNDEDCQKADALLNEKRLDGESRSFELQLKGKNQQVIETSWSTIWSDREQYLFCVIHDITERKQLERLKQDFIAMISHDLRTPLMSVHSSIELVQSGAVGLLEPVTEIELINTGRSIEHLIDLVNDLLDFEKLEAGRMDFEFVEHQLSEVFNESVRMIKSLSDEREITIKLPLTDLKIVGDQRKLVQVVVNILSNALKHTESGGLVQIETCVVDGAVEISVHDEGPGVPAEFAQTIFAPFEQIGSRPIAELGTGLGLAICKLIVEGHHGIIGVRSSSILKGSAFYFTVPNLGAPAPLPASSNYASANKANNNCNLTISQIEMQK